MKNCENLPVGYFCPVMKNLTLEITVFAEWCDRPVSPQTPGVLLVCRRSLHLRLDRVRYS